MKFIKNKPIILKVLSPLVTNFKNIHLHRDPLSSN